MYDYKSALRRYAKISDNYLSYGGRTIFINKQISEIIFNLSTRKNETNESQKGE